MAITAATKTSDFSGFLNREQSEAIFETAYQQSVVQRLAPRVPLSYSGKAIPVVTGKVAAGWVAEGAQKPATAGTMALKTMDPKKLAAIAVVSAEVVRANPGGYMDILRPQIAEAFATAFDSAALHGTNTPFSTYIDNGSTAQEFTGVAPAFTGTSTYDDLNAGLSTLVNAGKRPTGWALDARLEPVLNAAKDSQGRPLFLDAPYVNGPAVVSQPPNLVREGRLLGRAAFMSEGVYASATKVYGYLGDWTQVAWGAVGNITYSVSTQATVTINGALVSLWENNLVAVLAEAEYGFLVNDPASFIRYTNAT